MSIPMACAKTHMGGCVGSHGGIVGLGYSTWGAAGLALPRGEFAFLARASPTSQLLRPPRSSCCNAFAVVSLPSSRMVSHKPSSHYAAHTVSI